MAKKRRKVLKAIGDDPTPETQRKLLKDPVETMYRRGIINTYQRNAADEITIVWEALGRGMFPQATDFSRPYLDGGGKGFMASVETMTPREYHLYTARYKPWAFAAGKRRVNGTSMLNVVFRVVVDRIPIRQVEREVAIGNGRLGHEIRMALSAWADEGARRSLTARTA